MPLPVNAPAAAPGVGAAPLRRPAAGWNVLIFLAALATFEGVVDRISSPFQGADKVERKFAYFAAHKDDYDFVFVGSSRVMNQLSPRVFDAEMARAGRPCRSFNLGVAAMFLPECSFLIDRICALHPARLRGLLVEVSNPAPRHDAEHPLTERDIYWHHATPTALACVATLTDPDSRAAPGQRAAQVWLQATIFARCAMHLGTGPLLWERLRKFRAYRADLRTPSHDVVGPADDGFMPLARTLGQGQAGVAKTGGSTPDLIAFEENVATLRVADSAAGSAGRTTVPAGSTVRRVASAALRDILSQRVAVLRSGGIEPFFFIGPGTTREQIFRDLHADGTLPALLAFNDPEAYPGLYALDVRADRNHLNETGAERLSRLVADRIAAMGLPASDRARP